MSEYLARLDELEGLRIRVISEIESMPLVVSYSDRGGGELDAYHKMLKFIARAKKELKK